ncbi:MAG: pilus assembly protein PilP [Deltaproteobacteria bacterium]|nr:pilus assembly protein PilP [Deltaproteobacteria bacterium]
MYNQFVIMCRLAVFIGCFLFLIAGCDKQPESPKTQKVISKKIILPKKEVSKPKKTEQMIPPAEAKKAALQKTTTIPKTTDDIQEKKTSPSPPITIKGKTIDIAYAYDPTGKIDPFLPIFREKVVAAPAQGQKKGKKQRVPMTPLEKVSLSQLKLVGIMISSSGGRALVEEASGKGYVITKGTYIGRNFGQVVDIFLDRVVIEEEAEDLFGNLTIRKTEMKLQKAPGE